MAKSKSFFGLRRGSTKSHTYQVYRGEQITKDRVYDVSNPQTSAQMEQRLKLPMVANFVSALKPILDHSFEGVEYGEESLKYARSANLKSGALSILTYVPKGMTNAGVADFIVSKGTLEPVGASGLVVSGNTGAKVLKFQAAANAEKSNTEIGDEGWGEKLLSYIKPVFFAGEDYDQVTFIIAYAGNDYQFTNSSNESELEPYNRYVVSRLIFDPDRFSENSEWNIKESNSTLVLSNGYIELSFGQISSTVTASDDITISLSSDNTFLKNKTILMAAAIVSDLQNGTWKRSNESMLAVNPTEITYNDVVGTYLSSTNAVQSSKYLNTGNETISITGGEDTETA